MSRDSEEKLYKNQFVKRPVPLQITPSQSEGFKNYMSKQIEDRTKKVILDKINKDTLKVQPQSKQINDFIKGKTKTPFVYGQTESSYGRFDSSSLSSSAVQQNITGNERYKKERKNIVSVDSANRNTYIYPNANDFVVNLGRTFFNIKSIKVISSEFPNSERVVKNSSAGDAQNNMIEWINEEDEKYAPPFYSSAGGFYPFKPYSVELKTGNYSLNTIDDEMALNLNNNVLSQESLGDPHFFITETNSENGIVSLSSYKKFNLDSVSPVSTIFSPDEEHKSFFITIYEHNIKDRYETSDHESYIPDWQSGISVTSGDKYVYNNVLFECVEDHTTSNSYLPPFTQSKWVKTRYQPDVLYISGVTSVGGIPASAMNGIFTNFRVVSVNKIQVYIDIACSYTDSGGGNSGIVGVSRPYQLLFNDNQYNIGKVLGFPQENSSDYISESYLTTTTYSVKDVTAGAKTTIYTQVVYIGNSISTSVGGEVTITTSTPHNMITGDRITIQNSDCIPKIDSFITDSYLDQTYYTITYISDTSFKISPGVDVVTAGFFCQINFPDGDNQLVSNTVIDVSALTPDVDPSYTVITTTSPHGLFTTAGFLLVTNSISGTTSLPALNSNFIVTEIVDATNFKIRYTLEDTFTSPVLVAKVKYGGDKIKFDNSVLGVFSTPNISGVFLVEDATPTSFTIDFETSYIDPTTIKFGVIQSNTVTVYHPNHPFNRVIRSGNDSFKFDIGFNRLTLQEDSGDPFSLIYPTGIYSAANVSAYLSFTLSTLSPNSRTYTCSFVGDVFSISISSGTFKILGSQSNILTGLGFDMVDTGLASSFSGYLLNDRSTYLNPHRLYGKILKILDIKQDPSELLTVDVWVGELGTDTYTGDGATVNYITSNPIIFPEANEVYVNGVLQTDGVDYTYVAYSSLITFTIPPPLGESIIIKTVITSAVNNDYIGDGSTTAFLTSDDILDNSLVTVELDSVTQTLGVDYTISAPRTINFVITPDIDTQISITNVVNNTSMSKDQPRVKVVNSYVYTGILPNPISYVTFNGTYEVVDIPNTSVIRIPSPRDVSGYTFAGKDPLGPGQPYIYNSSGLLETYLFDYSQHFYSNIVEVDTTNPYTITKRYDESLGSFLSGEAEYSVDTIDGAGNLFKIYRVTGIPSNTDNLAGISLSKLNGAEFTINKVVGKDFYDFKIPDQYAYSSIYTSSGQIYISSYRNGFSYKQDNTGFGAGSGLGSGPFKALKLSGNNYVFLRSPGLETIANTNIINDVFAKILLSEPPGNIIFNSVVSNAKIFDEAPLAKLENIRFIVSGGDGYLYDFNNNDFSFSLEIVEYVDSLKNTGISSRTGSVDTSGHLNAIYTTDFDKKLVETTTGN